MADQQLDEFGFEAGRRMRFLVETNHLTVQRLAEIIGVGRVSLQEVLDGRAQPSAGLLNKVAQHFGVPPEFFTSTQSMALKPRANPPAQEVPNMMPETKAAPATSKTSSAGAARHTRGSRKRQLTETDGSKETLSLRSLAIRYQALTELLVAKGLFSAAEYREQISSVENRQQS
ncbi:MAG: helix-turn-helix domain-containing protein [Planctomycetota bacterium]